MKKNGEITVFLSMIALVFIGLIFALIRSAEVSKNKIIVNAIADISVNSIFSEYSVVLFDKYGLMYVDTSYKGASDGGDEKLLYKLNQYIDSNSGPSSDISYLSSDALRISHAADNNYGSVKEQIRKNLPELSGSDEEILNEYIRKHIELYDFLYEPEYIESLFEDEYRSEELITEEYKSIDEILDRYLEVTEYDEKFMKLLLLIEEDIKLDNPKFSFDNLIDGAQIAVSMVDSHGKVYECNRYLNLTE